jgi:hypothetical protein
MEIRIRVDRTDPPTGCLRRVDPGGGRDPRQLVGVAFVGWLGLLRALEGVIGSSGSRPPDPQDKL